MSRPYSDPRHQSLYDNKMEDDMSYSTLNRNNNDDYDSYAADYAPSSYTQQNTKQAPQYYNNNNQPVNPRQQQHQRPNQQQRPPAAGTRQQQQQPSYNNSYDTHQNGYYDNTNNNEYMSDYSNNPQQQQQQQQQYMYTDDQGYYDQGYDDQQHTDDVYNQQQQHHQQQHYEQHDEPYDPISEIFSMIGTYNKSLDPYNNTNVLVAVRKRPLNSRETARGDKDILRTEDWDKELQQGSHGNSFFHQPTRLGSRVVVCEPKIKVDLTKYIDEHEYKLDQVYGLGSTNAHIYARIVQPLVHFALRGGRGCCFAYGQTGSGKTYTMLGQPQQAEPGLYTLAIKEVFEYRPHDIDVYVSFYEIYNDKLYDLLTTNKNKLECRVDEISNVNIVGLTEINVNDNDTVMDLINQGNTRRAQASTGMNDESSRSHAILQFAFKKNQPKEQPIARDRMTAKTKFIGEMPFGKLAFVDLAGSERGGDTARNDKQTRQEGADINTSLLALKECIRVIAQGGQGVPPFRNSVLTQVLKDSLVGKTARTAMIATISPSASSSEHTINTLRYAQRLKEGVTPRRPAGSGTTTATKPTTIRDKNGMPRLAHQPGTARPKPTSGGGPPSSSSSHRPPSDRLSINPSMSQHPSSASSSSYDTDRSLSMHTPSHNTVNGMPIPPRSPSNASARPRQSMMSRPPPPSQHDHPAAPRQSIAPQQYNNNNGPAPRQSMMSRPQLQQPPPSGPGGRQYQSPYDYNDTPPPQSPRVPQDGLKPSQPKRASMAPQYQQQQQQPYYQTPSQPQQQPRSASGSLPLPPHQQQQQQRPPQPHPQPQQQHHYQQQHNSYPPSHRSQGPNALPFIDEHDDVDDDGLSLGHAHSELLCDDNDENLVSPDQAPSHPPVPSPYQQQPQQQQQQQQQRRGGQQQPSQQRAPQQLRQGSVPPPPLPLIDSQGQIIIAPQADCPRCYNLNYCVCQYLTHTYQSMASRVIASIRADMLLVNQLNSGSSSSSSTNTSIDPSSSSPSSPPALTTNEFAIRFRDDIDIIMNEYIHTRRILTDIIENGVSQDAINDNLYKNTTISSPITTPNTSSSASSSGQSPYE